MTWLAETCMLSQGWRRLLIVFLAGAVAALSVPPLFVLPALFLGLPVWVWCLDGAETGSGALGRVFSPAFWIGFFFGLGYFIIAIHWVGAAFFVDGGWMLLLMPFAVVALAAILALFWGVASALAHLLWSDGPARILALAAALTLLEFARGHLFSGFPFDLPGYALTANAPMMQLASVIGVYGLTALVLLMAGTPALIWPSNDRRLAARLLPLFLALLALAAQIGYGQFRLAHTTVTPRTDMKMRLVQPAIDQSEKWQIANRNDIVDELIALSETHTGPKDPGLTGITHLVWPEAAIPFYLSQNPPALARIARMLPRNTLLITGAPRQGFAESADPEANPGYNSILAIDHDGQIVGAYDKTHLVPFGEYLPFPRFFRSLGISQFVPGANGWATGDERRAFVAPHTPPFLPLICYEAIFSGDMGAAVAKSQFMLNVTNDAWFDGSIGPQQHFDHARVRAVEEGLSLVRVANTGITAMVDPLGRVTARLQPEKPGVLDTVPDLPVGPTLFVRWRHWPLLIFLVLSFAGLALARWRRDRNRGPGI